jgi:TetR/AcrR family transcriptional regulator, transcriptional repressor for nem operon
MPATRPRSDTAERVLDAAEALVQVRGFNGFSYADVAAELGMTKAGLHYHFPGKAELGEALIVRYTKRFGDELAAIDAREGDATAKLEAYVDLYDRVLRRGRMCLCGMLAAEYGTLPEPMRDAVEAFFAANEAWLERRLETGREDGVLRFKTAAREAAHMIVSGLEGAMLVARTGEGAERFRATACGLVRSVAGA